MGTSEASGRRRLLRLRDYDYSQAGDYFVTVCTQERASLFGEVIDREMKLNPAGQMISRWWYELGRKFPAVVIDVFVLMPNHLHGIIVIPVGADLRVGPASRHEEGAHAGAPLHKIVQWFKTMTTNEYMRGVRQDIWPAFNR